MKHPQDVARKLYDEFKCPELQTIAKYGCCAFVLLWCLGIEPDEDAEAVITVSRMIRNGAIQSDCTVKWYDAIKYMTGRTSSVDFIDIKTIKGIKDRTPVRFDYNGKSHWVGVEKGKIKFNPLGNSVCVNMGKPATMRKLNISGGAE